MRPKILVVDDEPLFCEIMSNFLEEKGYSVAVAYDGNRALEAYGTQGPDIVLLDVRMPGKDGLETLRELKALDPEANVMMITAILDEEMVEQALAEGAFDYITKPVSLHSLDLAIRMKLGLPADDD